MDTLLEKVKMALRLDTDDFDSEITDLVDACKLDLSTSGVKKIDDTDALIVRAVITYCRGNFDPTNPDFERYVKSYDSLKVHLCLCGDYDESSTT